MARARRYHYSNIPAADAVMQRKQPVQQGSKENLSTVSSLVPSRTPTTSASPRLHRASAKLFGPAEIAGALSPELTSAHKHSGPCPPMSSTPAKEPYVKLRTPDPPSYGPRPSELLPLTEDAIASEGDHLRRNQHEGKTSGLVEPLKPTWEENLMISSAMNTVSMGDSTCVAIMESPTKNAGSSSSPNIQRQEYGFLNADEDLGPVHARFEKERIELIKPSSQSIVVKMREVIKNHRKRKVGHDAIPSVTKQGRPRENVAPHVTPGKVSSNPTRRPVLCDENDNVGSSQEKRSLTIEISFGKYSNIDNEGSVLTSITTSVQRIVGKLLQRNQNKEKEPLESATGKVGLQLKGEEDSVKIKVSTEVFHDDRMSLPHPHESKERSRVAEERQYPPKKASTKDGDSERLSITALFTPERDDLAARSISSAQAPQRRLSKQGSAEHYKSPTTISPSTEGEERKHDMGQEVQKSALEKLQTEQSPTTATPSRDVLSPGKPLLKGPFIPKKVMAIASPVDKNAPVPGTFGWRKGSLKHQHAPDVVKERHVNLGETPLSPTVTPDKQRERKPSSSEIRRTTLLPDDSTAAASKLLADTLPVPPKEKATPISPTAQQRAGSDQHRKLSAKSPIPLQGPREHSMNIKDGKAEVDAHASEQDLKNFIDVFEVALEPKTPPAGVKASTQQKAGVVQDGSGTTSLTQPDVNKLQAPTASAFAPAAQIAKAGLPEESKIKRHSTIKELETGQPKTKEKTDIFKWNTANIPSVSPPIRDMNWSTNRKLDNVGGKDGMQHQDMAWSTYGVFQEPSVAYEMERMMKRRRSSIRISPEAILHKLSKEKGKSEGPDRKERNEEDDILKLENAQSEEAGPVGGVVLRSPPPQEPEAAAALEKLKQGIAEKRAKKKAARKAKERGMKGTPSTLPSSDNKPKEVNVPQSLDKPASLKDQGDLAKPESTKKSPDTHKPEGDIEDEAQAIVVDNAGTFRIYGFYCLAVAAAILLLVLLLYLFIYGPDVILSSTPSATSTVHVPVHETGQTVSPGTQTKATQPVVIPASDIYYCNTTFCDHEGSFLAAILSSDIEPCDNLYKHVCGSWPQRHPTNWSGVAPLVSRDTLLQDSLTESLLRMIKNEFAPADIAFVGEFQDSCSMRSELTNTSVECINDIFTSWTIKDWPLSEINDTNTLDDVWRFAGELVRDLGLTTLLEVTVGIDPDVPLRTVLELAQPRIVLRKFELSSTKIKDAIRSAVQEAMLTLKYVPDDRIVDDVWNVLEVLGSLNQTTVDGRIGFQLTPLRMLDTQIRNFLHVSFSRVSQLSDDISVILKSSEYINIDLPLSLGGLSPRRLLNYMGFLVFLHVAPFFDNPDSFTDLPDLFVKSVLGRSVHSITNHSILCLYAIHRLLPTCFAKAALLQGRSISTDVAARKMISSLESDFGNQLERVSWLGPVDPAFIRYRLKVHPVIRFSATAVDGNRSCSSVLSVFSNFKEKPLCSYFAASLTLQQEKLEAVLGNSADIKRRFSGSDLSTQVNYDPTRQAIDIPMAFLNIPVPTDGSALAFHLARVAVRFYRALVQVLVDNVYEHDVPLMLSKESHARLGELLECFRRDLQGVLPTLTPGEASTFPAKVLDQTMALKLSLMAFREQLHVRRIWNKDFRYNNFRDLTAEQLFFVYFALDNCQSPYDGLRTGAHEDALLAEDMVNLPLRHLAEFAAAFNCAPSSELRAEKVCDVFSG